MKGLIKAAFLIPLLALSLTGCKRGGGSSSLSSKGGNQEITINITSEPGTLDPRKARALTDVNLIRMFMDGLTRIDKSGKTSLAIAKKVDVSADQMIYTFTLRDCKWSNGDPVTSHDFAYAWKKSLSPNFNAPNANMLYLIKNAKEAKIGKLPLSLVGIEAPNDSTLVITLNHPTPYFLDIIANPIYFPVNNKIDRTNPKWAEKDSSYVGNGPFNMSEWKHHNLMEATKSPSYWDKKAVQLNQLKMVMVSEDTGFKMFDANDLNWDGSPFSTIPVDAIQSLRSEEKLHTAPVLATQWIRVNVEKAPFQEKKLRRAFAYAVDRQAIVDHIAQGNQIPATGIVPIAMGLQQTPLFEDGNVAMAEELFNEALSQLDISVNDLPEITLLYAAAERNHLMAQALQDQWLNAFGIQIRLEPVESKVFFDRVSKKDYTLSLGNWFADFNDPINFLEVFKTKDTGTNNTNWNNPSYTELLETSYTCPSKDERAAILTKSQEVLINDMPVIPIFHYTMLYIQDKELKDVVLTTMGNIDFKWAHLD
ncbi:MAG: peptide ABC transporter substrate-binding protein [Simkaniaceae bacterium]|nr:MAG: peptide ABC transporter substrate-binding protein [Simkaniaceae bacterium]